MDIPINIVFENDIEIMMENRSYEIVVSQFISLLSR